MCWLNEALNPSALTCIHYPLKLYGNPVLLYLVLFMDSVSVNKFRDNLKSYVEQIVDDHEPLKVTRRTGEDFVVVSAEDWDREQETLFVLQNSNLMSQIAASLETHTGNKGYKPDEEELSEITGL